MQAWSRRSRGAALTSLMLRFVKGTSFVVSLCTIAQLLSASPTAAKTPGSVHCFGGWCHRVNTVDEMDSMVGRRGMLMASYYDDCRRDRFNPCGLTSSGAVFRPDLADNAASPIFPDGTVLLAYNPKTKLAAVVRVTNAGPYRGDRKLDVSRATAERLGFLKSGVAELEVVVVRSPELDEARYSKRRTYAPVPGFLGRYVTFDDAHDAAVARLRMETPAVRLAAVAAPHDGESESWIDDRRRRLMRAAPHIRQSLMSAAPNILSDVREDLALAGNAAKESKMIAAAEAPVTDDALSAIAKRFAALVAAARSAAQLHHSGSERPERARLADGSERPLMDRARDFIRAAQMRARPSVKDRASFPGIAALVEPQN